MIEFDIQPATPVDMAWQIAILSMGGERNKHDGELYLLHIARVWANAKKAGGDEAQECIAILHDSVEDTPNESGDINCTFEDIRTAFSVFGIDFANRVTAGVMGMTKFSGETKTDYIYRCKLNDDSRWVKRNCDLLDNNRRVHRVKDVSTKNRLGEKYSMYQDVLAG